MERKTKSYDEVATKFADILRELLKEKGLNQLALSELLGVRQSQVSNWINSKSLPGYNSLRLLCHHLNVRPEVFF